MPSSLWTIDFVERSYNEEKLSKEVEPHKRALNFIVRLAQSKWHIRITFYGRLQLNQAFPKISKRRTDLQDLCHQIDFSNIKLLDDTVTELAISRDFDEIALLDAMGTELVIKRDYDTRCQKLLLSAELEAGNEYSPLVENLRVLLREDPFRVRFPYYDAVDETSTRDASTVQQGRELAQGVHEAHVDGDDKLYVYKKIARPLYDPRDSESIVRELRHLELLRGRRGIMQLVAAIVSENPYKTTDTCNSQAVLCGFLLEHHPNGTLHDALSAGSTIQPWARLARQMADSISEMHAEKIAHMDLKPKNILLDRDGNIVVGDISGYSGVTREWLLPEMMDILDPQISEEFEWKKWSDVWALGKMMSLMADASCIHSEKQMLHSIATDTNRDTPGERISLEDMISRFTYSNY